jgi:hypothetical protein
VAQNYFKLNSETLFGVKGCIFVEYCCVLILVHGLFCYWDDVTGV